MTALDAIWTVFEHQGFTGHREKLEIVDDVLRKGLVTEAVYGRRPFHCTTSSHRFDAAYAITRVAGCLDKIPGLPDRRVALAVHCDAWLDGYRTGLAP